MRTLQSYVMGAWHTPGGGGTEVRDATTGEPVAMVSSDGVDMAGVLEHARGAGGPALRATTFQQRAAMLKALAQHLGEHKDELYALSAAAGATRRDAAGDVDGGIGTLAVYAGRARRELPDTTFLLDGEAEPLAKDGSFAVQHVEVPLQGAAVLINAFNFPVWGMLEKLAPAILAGVPVVVKPATPTAYVAEACFRELIASGALPEGAAQLICGSTGDLLDHLGGQDLVGFTGSAATAARLRAHPAVAGNAVRFNAEADSLNASILGLAAGASSAELGLYLDEVVRELTTKTGQRCTCIRRALVPAAMVEPVLEGLRSRLERVVLGDPRAEGVQVGPLVSLEQREDVRRAIAGLRAGAETVLAAEPRPVGGDAERGAFLSPTLLLARDPAHPAIHNLEAFGPVCTVVPYTETEEAVALAALGQDSLVASVFTPDAAEAGALALGLASHHGRVLLVDESCGRTSTGHGTPMPQTVHGGPGRAGGGEELGGLRAVHHHLQRTAVQASPAVLAALSGREAVTA
ncbi:MAG TPA: phenylacetic acid degradation bifunctional protein PaaZ [Candidatus Dormibacteraeota bacterium]|nr:phenylacetic acid degradation bifunctional protein PaaZ [Candidatus Dormibacteraeota bacterium]